jgi:hypothetical protein
MFLNPMEGLKQVVVQVKLVLQVVLMVMGLPLVDIQAIKVVLARALDSLPMLVQQIVVQSQVIM